MFVNTTAPIEIDELKDILKHLDRFYKLTPKERTLWVTCDKYDTIIVCNQEIKDSLIKEFGELNIHVSKWIENRAMFFNSEKLNIPVYREMRKESEETDNE